MKTAHTYNTRNDGTMAAGFDSAGSRPRQSAASRYPEQIRAAGEDKVVDFTAWRAANMDELWKAPDAVGEAGRDAEEPDQAAVPDPQSLRSRRVMFTAELVSTLSVVAAAVALILRLLTL